jgi:uncharacterized protein YhaN
MIINKLRYKVYGKLIDHLVELSPRITVFFGDNEAGKSTIFNSLSTLIYGFKPPSREKHPYVNWSKNEINFSSEITENEELFTVERSLKSVPRFNISKSNSTQLFRNEPLPFVNHISDALFEAVFHLTAEDLNQFEKASFESIQEKLIFNYGSDYLNKASDVIFKLEQDINTLWRKDKRGNPRINQLQIEINLLKRQRHEAEKSYELIRAHSLRIDAIDIDLIEADLEKKTLERSLRQMRANLPIRELIERIDYLKVSLYKSDAFIELDPKLIDLIENNQSKLLGAQSKAEKADLAYSNLKEALFVYSEHDKKLLDFKTEIEPLKRALSDLIRIEHDQHSKLDALVKLREKIGGHYKILFESELDDAIKTTLKRLPVLDLMTLLQKYTDGYDKNAALEKRLMTKKSRTNKENILLGILGIIAFISGFLYESLWFASFMGIGALGYSLANIKLINSYGSSEMVDLNELTQKIKASCGLIVFPDYVYRDNSLRFFGKLEQLILLLHEEDALHENWAMLIDHQKAIEKTISDEMFEKGFDTTRGAVLSLQYVLAQMDRLTELEAIETKKQFQIDLVEASIQSIRKECRDLETDINVLKKEVENFGDGDYDFGLKMIAFNTELTRKIKVFSDELSARHYDFDRVLEATESRIVEMETKIVEIDSLEKHHLAEKYRLSSEIQKFNETINLEAINSQILVAKAELNECIELRNQMMVLLEIIKYSDERFRLENQPNIIQRVSYFMNQMTHGKYKEVLINEDNGHFDLQFLIDGEIIPVARAFSKGTIQQLFFAYRLAVLEALDPQHQLPFVLDEAFVNWDSKRFIDTLAILEDVSKERQIIIFTCHRNLADQIGEHTTSKLIEVAV